MIGRILLALSFTASLLIGFGFGSGFLPREKRHGAKMIVGIHPEREFQPVEFKSFAIVLYARNDAHWCERSLRSIFEQDYDAFRLLFVDDGSSDNTFERVQNFIIENQQEHRTILIRNETPIGCLPSLYRAAQHCLDKELILPLSAKDWLAGPSTLLSWNRAFQNPDIWIAFGRTILYPSYEFLDPPKWDVAKIEKNGYENFPLNSAHCFYSALFKQLSVENLFGTMTGYLSPLLELSGGRMKNVWEPVSFLNETLATSNDPKQVAGKHAPIPLKPLDQFPKSISNERQEADVVLFSSNQPMQLYAALESVQRNITGYGRIIAIYWADPSSVYGYEQIKSAFPQFTFLPQGKEFKRSIYKTLFDSSADYLLLSSDENLVKEPLDLRFCTEMLAKTRADGFYLHLNRPDQAMPLSDGIFAFNPLDQNHPISLDMGLYRKKELKSFFTSVRYEDFKDILAKWKTFSKNSICLSFAQSKTIPMPTLISQEELLSKFNQGLKIDLEPIYRGEHPEYITR